MTRVLLAFLMAAALALTSGGCGLFAQPTIEMISGRDDHGELQRAHIGLQRGPTNTQVAATARDADIVRVTERSGPWAHVVVLRTGEEGWIEDHYLRGEAVHHGTTPRRVRFVAAEPADGGVRVRVRYADDGSEQWVPGSALKEVGAR